MIILAVAIALLTALPSPAGELSGVLLSGSMYFDEGHTITGDQSVVVKSLGSDPDSPCEFHFPGDNKSHWTLSKYVAAPTSMPAASPRASPAASPSASPAPTPTGAAPLTPAQKQYSDQRVVAQPTVPSIRRREIKEGEPDEDGKIWHRDSEGRLKWRPANKVPREEKAPNAEPAATPAQP